MWEKDIFISVKNEKIGMLGNDNWTEIKAIYRQSKLLGPQIHNIGSL